MPGLIQIATGVITAKAHDKTEAGCVLLAGSGLRMGQVIGSTDSRGERSLTQPIRYQNIFATLYHALGIDPHSFIRDASERPIKPFPK